MKNYIDTLNETIKSYYKILSEDFPKFLNEYINTPEMLKQSKISVSCGTIYSKMYKQMWYSSLDHSIAVALISKLYQDCSMILQLQYLSILLIL